MILSLSQVYYWRNIMTIVHKKKVELNDDGTLSLCMADTFYCHERAMLAVYDRHNSNNRQSFYQL